jgi:hypothetical protein
MTSMLDGIGRQLLDAGKRLTRRLNPTHSQVALVPLHGVLAPSM